MSQHFDDDGELQNAVKDWLLTKTAEFYENGICKLVKSCDKCLTLNGDCVEK